MGMAGADAEASCLQTGTVCQNCSGTGSWQAWEDLIEKRAVTSGSSSGVTAAATVHLPAEGDALCPRALPPNCPRPQASSTACTQAQLAHRQSATL